MCDCCWVRRAPDRTPHRVKDAEGLRCCMCAMFTRSGIFVHRDPAQMPYCPDNGQGASA